jgi:hypothetical protein
MILEFSIGSRGVSYDAYTIRIPLTPAPGRKLEIGEGVCFKLDNLRVEIIPERYFYALTVGEFASESDAASWLSRVSVALLWLIVKSRFGLVFESVAEPVKLYDEAVAIAPDSPIAGLAAAAGWREVDGFYSADRTVIRPENKKLIRDLTGRPSVIVGVGLKNFIEALEVALQYPNPDGVLANRKLRLACEIYASSFFEGSRSARFLSLMTVLETLVDTAQRAEPLVSWVLDLVRQLQSRREHLVGLCGDAEFESLLGSLRSLSEKSIGQKIRSLLCDTLADGTEATRASEFGRVYEIRSRLVHQGLSTDTEISNAISTLDVLVPKVLECLLLRAAGAQSAETHTDRSDVSRDRPPV